ncbi:MAG: CHAT domain-containing protein, partial [Pseudomonadota bacterium]
PVFLEYAALLMAKAEGAQAQGTKQALLFEAREVINRLHAAEIRDYLQDDCAPSASGDSRALRLAGDVAVIFPIVFDDRVEVLLQTRDGMRQLPAARVPRAALEARVRDLRRRLSDPRRNDAARYAATFYDELFPGLTQSLTARAIHRLVVVPDGPLRLLPFGALHDGDGWLAERFVVEVMQRLAPARDALEVGSARSGRALLAGVSRFDGVEREALRYVPAELASIRNQWPGPTRTLAEAQFTKRTFIDSLNGLEPTVVHIATHGTFAGSLEQSYLLTGDGQRLEMEALFAPLEALAIRQRPVTLVVLSACETALGGERSAIGLAGVALRAGATYAAGALWPVPDDGTARLFEAFYTELATQRSDPGFALAVAQRELIASRRYAHPAYWSGFQVISSALAPQAAKPSTTLATLATSAPEG